MWKIIGYKGGGGGSTEKTSTIPDEWKPFITRSLQKAEGVSDAGDLAHVEALNEQQQEALRRSQNIADQYSDVASDYDATRTRLRDTAGLKDAAAAQAKEALATNQSQAALGGASGSARQQAREDAQANNLARSFADLDYQAEKDYLGTAGGAQGLAQQGATQLGDVGKTLQAQGQAEGDAQYQALNRLFGLYGSAPFQSQQTVQKGGGK